VTTTAVSAGCASASTSCEDHLLRTDRGFERALFFSDAVVAIAISLLILPLVDLVSDGKVAAGTLFRDHWGGLLAFALSFAVVARYWLAHHQLFEAVSGYTPKILWANILWLATIVFLPLPTEMLGVVDGNTRGVHALYIGSVLASSASLNLLHFLISRAPDVHEASLDASSGLISTGLVAAALVLAVSVPVIGMWAMLLMLLTGPLESLSRRRRTATAEQAAGS
jgi:uncharacterized membrane protein